MKNNSKLEALKPGDIVKFLTPLPDEDPNDRYVLLDDPAELERVDIRYICDLPIAPVQRVNRNEICKANGVEVCK